MTYRIVKNDGRLSSITADIIARLQDAKIDGLGRCKFYLVRTVGLNKHSHYSTAIGSRLLDLLDDAGITYREGNDAPRRGRLGEYVSFGVTRFLLTIRSRLNDKEDKNAVDRAVRGILSEKHIPSLEKRFPIYRINFENLGEFAARFSEVNIRCFSLEDAKEIAQISFGNYGVITISLDGKKICEKKEAGEWTQL